ncbi:Rpn family recombination-promoting nuclease/putative transposase [Nocardia stercoris]|uniref:Transposase (putative) YhgA-like domain-containing protein n=1 Tax=Nocardia stercoris TaxID=2483361 RepID=A0A3M2KW46_9NOCA|nr:Rpn family recombination-promoting nuclease/putative transposase [Nocardia stercoris]RMI29234.1 hypothetical protein EBN03_26140 [Nocardia stercoris]
MTSGPKNPHDTLFRRILSRPANAASELQVILPEEVVGCIDWSTLELIPGGFVSEQLRDRFTDLLYRARLIGGDEEVYLYLLIEHQARGDRFMALRMAEYATQFWRKFLDDCAEAKGMKQPKLLPPFIPIVVHTGPDGTMWTDPTALADLIDLRMLPTAARDRLAPYLPNFRFLLEDVAAIDLEALRRRPVPDVVRLLMIVERIAYHNHQLHIDLRTDMDLFRDLTPGDLLAFMAYILKVGNTSGTSLEPLVGEIGPSAKEALMTAADELVAQGVKQGVAQAEVDTLLKQLVKRFKAPVPPDAVATIRSASRERVQGWLESIFDAGSIDELLAC